MEEQRELINWTRSVPKWRRFFCLDVFFFSRELYYTLSLYLEVAPENLQPVPLAIHITSGALGTWSNTVETEFKTMW